MARILVVDDEEGIRSFLTDSLLTEDHEVVEAVDGVQASLMLDRQTFNLMITDLHMPGLDGMALLRKARSEVPEMEVVVLTAHGSVETAVEALKMGATDFLQKPLSGPDEIRLVAARAVERCSLRTLRDRTRPDDQAPRLTFGAPAMKPVVEAAEKVAGTDATVLLMGETGTGKEVVAQVIHQLSRRSGGPFVAVNCAALSETLLQSELFGHEKGAFTGADARRRGRIELADGGTFFLDEIAELDPSLQAKLLRVLQEKQFERVGGNRTIFSNVRWITATNRDLGEMMAAGTFREDLFHRLSVFPIEIPPLRHRREDIIPLAETLLARVSRELGRTSLELGEEAREALVSADWPGNVRELANVLERAAILSEGRTLDTAFLQPSPAFHSRSSTPAEASPRTLEDMERAAIEDALRRNEGHRQKAAEELGIGLRTLYDKLKRYDL